MSRSARPRVYHVIARLNVGGPAVHVSLLAAGLAGRYDPLVLTGCVGPHEGDMAYFAHERGVDPVILPGLGRELSLLGDAATLARLVRIFRRERPTIVHTHTAKAGFVGRLAARLARVPVVVHTFHGHVLRGYFGPAKTWVFTALERWLARLTDAIVTLGSEQRRDVLAMGIGRDEQVTPIPLGLDLDALAVAPRGPGTLHRALGVDRSVPLVGCVARLVPIKAHSLLLEAFAGLKPRNPDHPQPHLVLVGDGDQRTALEDRSQRPDLVGRVHFLGWRKDLEAIYPDLDVVVLASHNEGLPTAILEARAAGAPVVSTRVGSVADVITDEVDGWLVPAGDVAALAGALGRVLADPGGSQSRAQSVRIATRDRYGVSALVERMDTLYQSLIHQRKAA